MNKKELKECLESWRKSNWRCCEDKEKGIKACMYDEHGKDMVKSIMEFFDENGFFVKSTDSAPKEKQ